MRIIKEAVAKRRRCRLVLPRRRLFASRAAACFSFLPGFHGAHLPTENDRPRWTPYLHVGSFAINSCVRYVMIYFLRKFYWVCFLINLVIPSWFIRLAMIRRFGSVSGDSELILCSFEWVMTLFLQFLKFSISINFAKTLCLKRLFW